jgi:hypothetical protein
MMEHDEEETSVKCHLVGDATQEYSKLERLKFEEMRAFKAKISSNFLRAMSKREQKTHERICVGIHIELKTDNETDSVYF